MRISDWSSDVCSSDLQVRLRAHRLGLGNAPVRLAAATSVRDILTTLGDGAAPALLIIDSIQTMHSDLLEGAPGTVSQVRAAAQELIRYAKETGTALVRSEEHTSELQSLMRMSYAVFCFKKKT